jgi:hemerythrin-like domain-containing protein
METTIRPIKRHEAIVQFSREHHFGLLLIWKIRQGLANGIDPQRISDYVLYFFEEDLKTHFDEEERVLFPRLDDTDLLKRQALEEHREIYSIIAQIRSNNNAAVLTHFAGALDMHIRFEERVLFNHLQNQLSEDELAALAVEHPVRTTDIDSKWNDHFWIKKQ